MPVTSGQEIARCFFMEFMVSQTMEHFLGCHQRALEYLGGVPAEIMVDNLTLAVLQRVNFDFSNHYFFRIVPCGVGKGNGKGNVENAVGYVKKNFLAGLAPGDFKTINPASLKHLLTNNEEAAAR